jgi:hypothetical protein
MAHYWTNEAAARTKQESGIGNAKDVRPTIDTNDGLVKAMLNGGPRFVRASQTLKMTRGNDNPIRIWCR